MQVFPADHADNPVVRSGEAQQKIRLLTHPARLHGNRSIQALRAQFGQQVGRQAVFGQGFHAGADPGIRLGLIAPEMLVRVYSWHGQRRYRHRISLGSGTARAMPVSS